MRFSNTSLTLAVASVGLAFAMTSSTANAGGLGILTTGGFHTTPVTFYDSGNNDAQLTQSQAIYSLGAGFDLTLGDPDDRVVGGFRGYWLLDSAEKDPALGTSAVNPANVVAAWREESRSIGIASVGVVFGMFGDPNRFQMTSSIYVGSGFLTPDHSEFLLGEVGVGATWNFMPGVQAFGTVQYSLRSRKGFRHGANAMLGVRYLFD